MIEASGITPKMREEFLRAVKNSVNHSKRSFLDFIDFQRTQNPDKGPFFGYLAKRVHNDVSIIEDQIRAAFEIVCNGGEIPAFGRTEAEREARKAS